MAKGKVVTADSKGKVMTEIRKSLPATLTDEDLEQIKIDLLNKMSQQQIDFCKYYIATNKASEAVMKMDGHEMNRRSAAVKGWQYYHNESVMKYIMVEKMILARRVGVNPDKVMQEISAIAFSNLTEYINVKNGVLTLKNFDDIPYELKAAIRKIKETKYGIEFELHDKGPALHKLAEAMGIFRTDPTEDAIRKALGNIVRDAIEMEETIENNKNMIEMSEDIDFENVTE